jgi:hypothetical protein
LPARRARREAKCVRMGMRGVFLRVMPTGALDGFGLNTTQHGHRSIVSPVRAPTSASDTSPAEDYDSPLPCGSDARPADPRRRRGPRIGDNGSGSTIIVIRIRLAVSISHRNDGTTGGREDETAGRGSFIRHPNCRCAALTSRVPFGRGRKTTHGHSLPQAAHC